MKLSIADNTNPNSLASRMRRKRLAIFLEMIHACPKSRVSVIDVGARKHSGVTPGPQGSSDWKLRCSTSKLQNYPGL